MAVFKYTAQTRDGKVITSTVDAINLNLAVDTLTASRLKILEIKKVAFDPLSFFQKLGGINKQAIVLFSRRIALMLRSGLPLARGLQILYEQEVDRKLKTIIMTVLHDVRVGASLSWALAKHPEAFPSLYISMVKVGEATGDLSIMIDKLGDFLERDLRVRQQAKSALTYPLFVFIICILLVAVIFMFILPNILNVFAGMTSNLPLPTQVVFFILATVRNPYVELAVALAVVYYAIYFKDYIKTPEGKYKFDKLVLKLPLVGNLNRKLVITHFCRALGILLATGIPMLRSMEILMEFMDNTFFKQDVIAPLYEEIKAGRSVSQALEQTHFFPMMISNMIAVGESTGELPLMLNKVSNFYDMEIVYALEGFLSLIEPVMIFVMGIVTCFVLLAVFMPLYQFIMQIK
jgi:type IV pilus assembly protein PilC